MCTSHFEGGLSQQATSKYDSKILMSILNIAALTIIMVFPDRLFRQKQRTWVSVAILRFGEVDLVSSHMKTPVHGFPMRGYTLHCCGWASSAAGISAQGISAQDPRKGPHGRQIE